MSEKWIRASELSQYMYCRRAWWLQRTRNLRPQNVRELAAGTSYHRQHGRLLGRSVWARRLAYALLFVAVALATFQLLVTLGA